jgi:hypothetical protein
LNSEAVAFDAAAFFMRVDVEFTLKDCE